MPHPEVSPEAALLAALYASVHRGIEGDLAFYRNASRGAARVLDLGCGAGRIALALARDGAQVVGLDTDPALLARARAALGGESAAVRQRLSYREGDVRSTPLEELFDPPAKVDRIVMAHSVIFCFTREELSALLPTLRACLVPDGVLLFDTYPTDTFHEEGDPDDEDDWGEVARVHVEGEDYRVMERSDWDRAAQRLTAHYRYERAGSTTLEATIEHHYRLSAEVEALLEGAGFTDILLSGDFAGSPFDGAAVAMVVAASP